MKSIKFTSLRIALLLGLIFTLNIGCERDLSDEAAFAKFPNTAEVFIDGFSGGLEYLPFEGSKPNALSIDTQTKYDGTAAMRFDVPNFGDPAGAYAGAIFPDYYGRDLTVYDALTFWAMGSQAATINEIGFGNDFIENKYMVTKQGLRINTAWTKYVIPIPDPYKLNLEKGMFWYATGPENNNGFSFWIDELKYEKLGTLAQPKPAILNGEDIVQTSFIGSSIDISSGLSQTFNMGSGLNETVLAAPGYFSFSSTDVDVARVNELGIVSVVGKGTAEITAILDGVKALGSLTVEVIGQFTPAPIPPYDPAQVISIFSDVYTNVPVDFYNGYYEPFQTTTSNDFEVNGDKVLNYENYNFVGIEFNQNVPTINASAMTKMHLDIFIPNSFDPESTLRINLVDFGPDNSFGGGDNSMASITLSTGSNPPLVSGQWIGVELDITSLANRSNLGQIIFDATGDTSPRPSSFYVDNIYLYKQ